MKNHYNHQRIKVKLKGMRPVGFRIHAPFGFYGSTLPAAR
ncbi:IS3 family transposase [Peribacillus muralis]